MTPTTREPVTAPCAHEQFKCDCKVARLSEIEAGPITGYQLDIEVKCVQCGLQFRFRGIPAGNDPDFPRTSIDGTELRAPIEPASEPRFSSSATYRLPAKQRVQ